MDIISKAFRRRYVLLFFALCTIGLLLPMVSKIPISEIPITLKILERNDGYSTGTVSWIPLSSNDSNETDILREMSLLQQEPKRRGENIIFLETRCTLQGIELNTSFSKGLVLTNRQACAIESAAKMNPDRNVSLLYTCPIIDNINMSSEAVLYLLQYPNVNIFHINVTQFFEDTPLENWGFFEKVGQSKWPLGHASDVFRFLSLWKYGGTYLDMDFVIMQTLSGLSNFAGAESNTDVAAGVLNFDSEGLGHEMAEACLENLRKEFKGDDWGNNGPGVITRVLKKLCKVRQVKDMTPERCRGFAVLPPSSFYPIPWRQWKLYFDEANSAKTMARVRNSMAIHVWNKFSVTKNVTVGSRQPYGLIAQQFCPKVYSHCGPVF